MIWAARIIATIAFPFCVVLNFAVRFGEGLRDAFYLGWCDARSEIRTLKEVWGETTAQRRRQ